MRLRTYLLSTAVLVVGLVLAVFAVWTRSVTEGGARQVSAAQVRQLSEVVRGALEARVSVLRDFSRVLRVDNDLSRAFLLARETHDPHLIQTKLDKVRGNGGFDLIEILPFKDAASSVFDDGAVVPFLAAAEAGSQGMVVTKTRRGPAVAFFSAIEHYGSPVGALVIGYLLDGRLKSELESLTASRIDLRVGTSDEAITIPVGTQVVGARITPKERIGDGIGSRVMRGTLIAGALCLGLLVALFALVLEVGFFQSFRALVHQGNLLAEAVSRGETPAHSPSSPHIRENRTIDRVLTRLADGIRTYQRIAEEKTAAATHAARHASVSHMARDVAHNIGSSLTTLEANLPLLGAAPEQVRTAMRKATREIRDRVQSLREEARAAEDALNPAPVPAAARRTPAQIVQLASLIEDVVSERRSVLARDGRVEVEADINEDAYGAFAKVDVDDLRAVIANLINNAAEAISGVGKVNVRVQQRESRCEVTVVDTGKGIPSDLLPRLSQRGVTFGKSNGSGLGLAHAKDTVETWGGTLEIESAIGVGTTVRVSVPAAAPPAWHLPRITLDADSIVCVLDDDESIHSLWDLRLSRSGLRSTVRHFREGASFSAWIETNRLNLSMTQFLVDYELRGDTRTGLDYIEVLAIEDRAALVTGRFDEPEVLRRAKFIGVKVLPKPLASVVPISVKTASDSPTRSYLEQPSEVER